MDEEDRISQAEEFGNGKLTPIEPMPRRPPRPALVLPAEGLTLETVLRHLTPRERRWLMRKIEGHGKVEFVNMWPSLEIQINAARAH